MSTTATDSSDTKLEPPTVRDLSSGIRLTGNRALVILTILVLLVGAGGVALWRSNAHESDVEKARESALAAATDAVPSLLTYDANTVATLAKSQAGLLTGSFAQEYAALVNDQLAPAAKKRELVTHTEVASGAVVSGDTSRVTVLLFLNQVSLAKDMKTPAATGSRVRVALKHVAGQWRIDELTPL